MGVLIVATRMSIALFIGFGFLSVPASAQTDQFGAVHDLASPSRVTVVDFAAAWCPPCWTSLPQLQDLARRFPDVQFLVVSVDAKVEGRDQLVRRIGLTLPVIWDANHAIAERFQPQGMPATFVLDAEGSVIFEYLGYNRKVWDAFVRFLEKM
jgi:thiol-disulfide isomerase/thioredoxin